MNPENNITYNYAQVLRSVFQELDARYLRRKNKRPETTEAEVFGIDPTYTSETFLSAIYLIEDTSQAIGNYLEHGLDGPTKYDNIGERYLRLYGLLNSVYMQFVSCQELYRIYKIEPFEQFYSVAKKMKILKARHTVAAHSVNYTSDEGKDFYKVAQSSVFGYGENLIVIGQRDSDYEVNLKDELQSFTKFLHSELSKITRTILERQFDPNSKVFHQLTREVELLDEEVKGSIVRRGTDDLPTVILKTTN